MQRYRYLSIIFIYMNTINWLTFIIGGFIPTVFLSTWIVARFIWVPMKKQFEAMKMPPRPYYMRYIIEDEEFNSKDNPIDTNNFVIEDTPKGTVLMKYSKISMLVLIYTGTEKRELGMRQLNF